MRVQEIGERARRAWEEHGWRAAAEPEGEKIAKLARDMYVEGFKAGYVTSDYCSKPCCTSPYNPVVVPWTASDRGQE